MHSKKIEDIFRAFQDLKVLIVGDVMVDAYIWGKVERISPEAPVPVVHVRKKEMRLGGAANVALNIQALGATPLLCTVIGQDAYGQQFRQLLEQQHISPAFVTESRARTTTVKERILAGSQQMLRVDLEDDSPLQKEDDKALMQSIEKAMEQADVVIFQDYDKGVLNEANIQQIIGLARQHGIPTAVDPKKRNFLHYRHTSLFKPNLKELKEGLKTQPLQLLHTLHAPERRVIAEASAYLKKALPTEAVLVTLSENGVFVDTAEGAHFIPAHVRQIADVSGAGDTVISIAALCLAQGLPSQWLAQLSNLGGGIVCEYAGVVPVSKDRLLEEAKRSIDFISL